MKLTLVVVAVVGETALVAVAVLWARVRGLSLEVGGVAEGMLAGLLMALVFVVGNWYVLCRAPNVSGIVAIRRLYRTSLKPLFGGVGVLDMVVISVAAGVGEELLFRGVVQPEVGLFPASVIFGLLHMGGTGTLAFGCWVAVMGGVLGGLAIWTEGLLAPVVAHAVYDAAAMAYIRWAPNCPAVAS